MQIKTCVQAVRVLENIVDTLGVKATGTPLEPVYDIALLKQRFSKVRIILPGDIGDQCHFAFSSIEVEVMRGVLESRRKPVSGLESGLFEVASLAR